MFAHVAGIPIEETALALTPVAAIGLAEVIAARARLARLLRALFTVDLDLGSR